jgi:glycosyltransferase involved in cell wall biosynthesis
MRIGIDIRELRKDSHTGIGRYIINFIEVASQKRKEFEFYLYGNQFSTINRLPQCCTIKIIPERLTCWWDHITLANQLNKDSIDLFLSPYYKAPFFARCPVIITIHDLMFLYISERKAPRKWIYNALFKFATRRIAKKAHFIITDSYYSKSEIIQFLQIPDSKIKVIYLGVSPLFHPVSDEKYIELVKQKYQIKGEYLFYLGNFKPHKNVIRLIEAYHLLPQDYRNQYSLVLAGAKDNNLLNVLAICKDLEIEKHVIYIEAPTERDLPALYSGARAFIIPSLAEGFGLPAIEAMACATPVIAGNGGSLPEIVGNAGIIVDSQNTEEIFKAINKLINDYDLCNLLIKKGLLRVKEFNYVHAAEKIIALIDDVLKDRGVS